MKVSWGSWELTFVELKKNYLLFPLGDHWDSRLAAFFRVPFFWAYVVKIPVFVFQCLGQV